MKALALVILTACAAPRANAPAPDPDDEAELEPPSADGEGDDGAIEPVATAAPRAPSLLAEANRELAAMQTSTYSHHTHVDEASGRFDYDCSGFALYALARSAPASLHALIEHTTRRPLAKHFVAFLAAGGAPSFRPIANARELAPGDVIAWLEPADVVSRNTGHVLIVRAAPREHARDELAVPIIDSTSVRHGRTDSRTPSRATGLGTGEIFLLVDDRGAPVGYRWSSGHRAHPHTTTIVLGRTLAP